MNNQKSHGKRRPGRSEEYKVPREHWREDLINVADQCAKSCKIRQKFDGIKHKVLAFWEVIVYAVLFNVSIGEASNQLNKIKIAEKNRKQRRKKPQKVLGGPYERHERLVPDKSQVNDFKRKLPKWFVKNLEQFVLKSQVDYLLGCKMLPKRIDVIIDFNEKPYYGKLKTGDSKTLHGTTKAPGTHRVRKFLGVMIKAGSLRVFTHFDLIYKGIHHDEFVKNALGELLSWGFTIRRVLADRWFANRGVLEWCKTHGIEYIGPIKKRSNITAFIHQYLKTGKDIVFSFLMHGDPTRYGTTNPLQVWIFLATRDKERLSVVRREYLQKKITLEEATKKIHVYVVTSKPPANKQERAAWLRSLARYYKHRWFIETGFRDLDRIQPTCHARTDTAKIFCTMMRCWLYNAWQIERAWRRRLRGVPAETRHGPTLREFCNMVYESDFKMTNFATA